MNFINFCRTKKRKHYETRRIKKMLENLLWEFRIQYSDELNKSELRSIIEVIALLIIKVRK